MDDDAMTRFNRERWEALVQNNVAYSRPFLDLDQASAREIVDPFHVMGSVEGKDVLCLAGGGGQQSVAFALLGANVTVVDFAKGQLDRDREALDHYGLQAHLVQGDMRDLSQFPDNTFDLVWHAFSVNFIPDINPVFDEAVRVLRSGGLYRIEWHNPFAVGIDETEWDGKSYPMQRVYRNGKIVIENNQWDITADDGTVTKIAGPQEFNHTLGTVINGLIRRGMLVLGFWEETVDTVNPRQGTWEHFKSILPPWFTIWAQYQPEAFEKYGLLIPK
jgi:SAM-dependent methyltransferase